MIRRLLGRLRMIYRPWWLLPAMIVFYLTIESPYAWLIWWKKVPFDQAQEVVRVRDTIALLGIFLYGAFRVASHHPLFWVNYGRWLARTPWRSPEPLPLGPIHLALRDVAVVAVLMLAMHDPYFSLIRVPLLFFMGYLASLCLSLTLTSTIGFAFALAFGLGLSMRLWSIPWLALGVAAVLYPMALVGVRRSLAGFPWSKPYLLNLGHARKDRARPDQTILSLTPQNTLGWPYGVIQPTPAAPVISYRDGTLTSLLVGWWAYAASANAVVDEQLTGMLVSSGMMIVMSVAAVRLLRYCGNYRPPISLFGRLLTLCWIIPGYDKVFVAPIGALAVFLAVIPFSGVGKTVSSLDVDPRIAIPVTIAASLLIALNVGPTLKTWKCTGSHRIVPTSNRQMFVEI
jgi:hypothetical protein